MRRKLPLVTGMLAIIAFTASCSDDGDTGRALPVTTTPGTSAPASSANGGESLPAHGAPKVEVPLDRATFEQTPCDSLTSSQLTELFGVAVRGEPDPRETVGPTCNWHDDDSTASVGVMYTKDGLRPDGVSGLYAQKDTLDFFQPMASIQGYPVVAYSSSDGRADGYCQVAIGTSDRSAMDIGITQSQQNVGKTDPCEAAHGVAEMVIGNIVGAG
jgi:hypothetical protein